MPNPRPPRAALETFWRAGVNLFRRGSKNGHDDQAGWPRIRHAVRNTIRSEGDTAGSNRLLLLANGDIGYSFNHDIQLVLTRMRVHCVFLSRLEAVEPREQLRTFHERRFAHFFRGKLRCRRNVGDDHQHKCNGVTLD